MYNAIYNCEFYVLAHILLCKQSMSELISEKLWKVLSTQLAQVVLNHIKHII